MFGDLGERGSAVRIALSATQSSTFAFSVENSKIARMSAGYVRPERPERLRLGQQQQIYTRISLSRTAPVPFRRFLPAPGEFQADYYESLIAILRENKQKPLKTDTGDSEEAIGELARASVSEQSATWRKGSLT